MSIPNVYLVGPMGSGKSAVGRRLARFLSRDFYDSDDEIETSTGVDIRFIFEKEGEAGFRIREEAMIERLTGIENIVLATGGGAVLRDKNRQRMKDTGFVVYLQTSIQEQINRTMHRSHRPLLENDNPEATLKELASIRNPIYEALADLISPTDGLHVHNVAKSIATHLRRKSAP